MAVICRDYGLLFIMVPGTGCSAIGGLLRERLGGRWVPEKPILRRGKQILNHKHNTVAQLLRHRVLTPAEVEGLVKFATIRNPYDLLVTNYQRLVGTWMEDAMNSTQSNSWANRGSAAYREQLKARKLRDVERARSLGFGPWLKRTLVRANRPDWRLARWVSHRLWQAPWHSHSAFPMIDGVDDLIRYERLEEDLNRILQKAGVREHLPIPHRNPTPGKKAFHEYYTPELEQMVEHYIGDQLAQFGYSLRSEAPADVSAGP